VNAVVTVVVTGNLVSGRHASEMPRSRLPHGILARKDPSKSDASSDFSDLSQP